MPGISVEPDDVCIYVTESCNSNCIMCPMSLDSRRRGQNISEAEWASLINIIPPNTHHITITGGEPFLEYQPLQKALQEITRCYPDADILILTNGRAFSIPAIADTFFPILTQRCCVAIPIHAPFASLHDQISQTNCSFDQSMKAIKALAQTSAKIEIRIVGHRLNIQHLNDTFRMLVNMHSRIDVVNLIAMEMTGCAAANRNQLWLDYREICRQSQAGILYAIQHSINVGLYNFPLCTVPTGMWPLVKDSITPSKVRYASECEQCIERHACGGLFYSTFELGLCPLQPFERGK